MACFTDTPPANWTYNILLTISGLVSGYTPVTLGCYSAMNSSEQAYQFYQALNEYLGNTGYITQQCFVQLTEPQQWEQLNDIIAEVLAP
jgi:hypothetical protein